MHSFGVSEIDPVTRLTKVQKYLRAGSLFYPQMHSEWPSCDVDIQFPRFAQQILAGPNLSHGAQQECDGSYLEHDAFLRAVHPWLTGISCPHVPEDRM